MKLYYPITVDLYNVYPLPKMTAQQYNVGRGALITLTANGQVVELSEETVRVFARRPDGNVSYLDCVITEDGKIQADFTDQMLAANGSMEVELEFTTADTNITTPIFIVEVNKSNVKEGVKSSNEFKALEKYTAEASEYATSAEESANAAKEAMQAAQEIKDSIPKDYTELTERVEDIYKANAIITTHEGTTIVTKDSANVPLVSLTTFGKSKQNQYEGTNILPPSISINATGLDVSINENKEFVVSGTTRDATGVDLYLFGSWNTNTEDMGIRGDITFCCDDEDITIVISHYDGTETTLIGYIPSKCSVTITDENYITGVAFRFLQNTEYNKTIQLWANEGTEKLPFEPYVGGEASPNLNYPQEVTPIGEGGSIVEKVLSGNLFDSSHRKSDGNLYQGGCNANEENGLYSITATSTDAYINTIAQNTGEDYDSNIQGMLMQIPNGITIISISLSNKDLNKNFVTYFDENKRSLGYVKSTSNEFSQEPLEGAKYFTLRFGKGDAVVGTTYETTVMVNYGEPMDYKPYTEQPLTLRTPNGLPGIPLGSTIPDAIANSEIHMSGVYHDGEQYWIGDTVDENGEGVQRIAKLKPTSTIVFEKETSDVAQRYVAILPEMFNGISLITKAPMLCTRLIYSQWALTDKTFILVAVNNQVWYMDTSKTMDEVNALFAEVGTDIEFYAVLTEPLYVVPLPNPSIGSESEETVLVMNKGYNTLMNDAGAHTKIEQVCDTQMHIEQNYIKNSVVEDILERLGNVEAQLATNS